MKNRLVIVSSIIVLAIICSFFIWQGFDGNSTNKGILDSSSDTVEVYRYESGRSFNGDGYTFVVQELNEDTGSVFDEGSTENFPEIEYREGEAQPRWFATPYDKSFDEVIEFALDNDYLLSEEGAEKLSGYTEDIRNVTESEGGYYAYVVSSLVAENGGRPMNIDLFVVDTESNLTYFIKSDI